MPTKLIEPLPGQPFKTLTLRVPEDMHAEIVSLANEEHRTLHGQLLVLLEQALQPPLEEIEERDTLGR